MSMNFLIKHRSGGQFIHPIDGASNPGNNWPVVLHRDIHSRMFWTFEQIDNHWGYIKHASSGTLLHPKGGSLDPGNDTLLVTNTDRHHGALFAIDQANNCIIHRGGKYVHPKGGSPNPGNEAPVVLYSGTHAASQFQCVATDDQNKVVMIYGNPKVEGGWKIINMVRNPIADHEASLQVKIGRSETESSTTTFQYEWEVSASAAVKIFSASATASVSKMVQKSATTTWTEEVTMTRTIRVSAGQTVVTWQYMFDAEQNASHSIYQSNLLADTDSENKIPEDVQFTM